MYLSVHQRERCQLEFQTFLTRLPDIGALSVLCCAMLCCAVLCCAPSLQSCLIPCFPMDCSTPGSSVHGILQQEYWSGLSCTPPGDLPNPGIKSTSPVLQADYLPTERLGKPKNTGVILELVDYLFSGQVIFLTQKLNWGLFHCRRILYQLSYQGSPDKQ